MNPPPVVLLDFDGVINADRPSGTTTKKAHAYAEGHSYKIHWSPDIAGRLDQLNANGTIEVRWCSTWCGYTNQFPSLGLPDFPDAFKPAGRYRIPALKHAAAASVLASGRELIWIDDDVFPLGSWWNSSHLVQEMKNLGGRGGMLICPTATGGLTRADLYDVETFASRSGLVDIGGAADIIRGNRGRTHNKAVRRYLERRKIHPMAVRNGRMLWRGSDVERAATMVVPTGMAAMTEVERSRAALLGWETRRRTGWEIKDDQ